MTRGKVGGGARRFALAAIALTIALEACTLLPFVRDGVFPGHLRWNAGAVAEVLRRMGHDAVARGSVVGSSEFALDIVRGCDAIDPCIFFAAATLAFPVGIGPRLAGLLGGAIVLLGANIVRIVSLFHVGLHHPRAFDVVHVEVWQAGFVLFTLAAWTLWARWAVGRRGGVRGAPA